MHLVALALSLVGIAIGWLPGIGWFGLALCAAALVLSVHGLSGRRTLPSGIGYSLAATGIAGLAMPWILALQNKYAGGAFVKLLPEASPGTIVAVAAGAAVAYFGAALLGRFKARPVFALVAIASAAVFTLVCASGWVQADWMFARGESFFDAVL